MKAYTNKKMYGQDTVGYLLNSLDRILSDDEAWGITLMECRRKIIDGLREKIRDIVEKKESDDD